MTIPAATKTDALSLQSFDFASLHSAFPGTSGANEISGGTPAYTREAITLGAEAGGARTLVSSVVFDVPAGAVVAWVGYWEGGVFRACAPSGGGVPKNFVAAPSQDRIYSTAHGWVDGQAITFFGVPPGGLEEGVLYYTRDGDADSFRVTTDPAGAAIELTSGASAGSWVSAIKVSQYPVQGTYQLTSTTLAVPD